MTQTTSVLVIDDEPQICRFLRTILSSEGYVVIESEFGEKGLSEAASHPPDIVLLDLGLPDIDGLEVVRRLRTWSTVPIIIISARGQETDKISALDAGADDYLTKPFSVPELLARIRAAIRNVYRKSNAPVDEIFVVGGLKVDVTRRQVFVDEREIHLTPLEFKLLTMFIKNAGRVITHRQLLMEVWGPDGIDENNSLRFYIHQLRHKIENDAARPKYLQTETGVGYRLHC